MKKRTPEQWQPLFAEHQASGLTQAQFCKQRGLCPNYFSLRRRQLADHQRPPSVSRFIQVQPRQSQSFADVSLHYPGRVIRFAQADAPLIAAVAKSLA